MVELLIGLAPYVSTIIVCSAVICAGVLILTIIVSKHICKEMSSKNDSQHKAWSFNWINCFYNIFLALVSIFPLLGMLGTVLALLGLDLSSGATEQLKQQFFLALDTTAWGLFFSIIFKILHSLFQTKIETAVEKIDELLKKSIK